MPEYSFVKNGIAAPKYKFNFCVNYGGLWWQTIVYRLLIPLCYLWRKEDDLHVNVCRALMLESFQNKSSSFIFDRVPNKFLPFFQIIEFIISFLLQVLIAAYLARAISEVLPYRMSQWYPIIYRPRDTSTHLQHFILHEKCSLREIFDCFFAPSN